MADTNNIVELYQADESTLPYFELRHRAGDMDSSEFNRLLKEAEKTHVVTQTEDLGGYFYTLNGSEHVQEV